MSLYMVILDVYLQTGHVVGAKPVPSSDINDLYLVTKHLAVHGSKYVDPIISSGIYLLKSFNVVITSTFGV